MRIFVAGATGVIGQHLLPILLEHGHEVTGMTRTEAGAQRLREMGVEPAMSDAYDAAGVEAAVAAAAPEVVVHELTDLPDTINPRRLKAIFARNDRMRREGTANLVRAAVAARARRMVAQSVAFLYAPEGGPVKGEAARLYTDAPEPYDGTVAAVLELERQVMGTPDLEGVVLRYGYFYGPGTAYSASSETAEQVRKRRFPIVGSGDGVFSFVHVTDAAEATVCAVEGGDPDIYNVVDDNPAAVHEWLPAYAQALGAPSPRRVPPWLARLVTGPAVVYLMTEQRGASNAKFRARLCWTPRYLNWRDGFKRALG